MNDELSSAAISRVRLRLTADGPDEIPARLASELARAASYSLAVTFDGFAAPAAARRFLDAFCRENPYSVVDLVLETHDPEECRAFLECTRELPLRAIPSLTFEPRFQRPPAPGHRPQAVRHLLCPAESLFAPLPDPPAEIRHWVLATTRGPTLQAQVSRARAAGWSDGVIVRDDLPLTDGLIFAVYAYFLFGRELNLRFADPLLDQVYRRCLLRDETAAGAPAGRTLTWDGREVRVLPAPAPVPPDTWARIYRALGDLMGESLSDAVRRLAVA